MFNSLSLWFAHLGDELADEDELVARLGALTRLGVARHRRRVQPRRAVDVLHAVLEFVVALHVVVHVAADLDGVALPEAVVGALDLLRHQRVELQRGAQAGADLVLVLVGTGYIFSQYN